MTQYNAQLIEEIFTRKAWIRAGDKIQGDGGYWSGGRCEYGGAHKLKEDCQTLARFFNDITELKNVQKDLINFNNRTEFEKNKQELLNKTNQTLNGLNIKTGSNTSIGGVCIIWDDFAEFMDSIVSDFRKEIESLKRDIEGTQYEEAQELALLEQKEGELKQEIEENERKAANEPDPEKKKKFIFLADEAKSEWKKLLEKKKQLKISSLGDNFNPDKHINDFLKSIRDSLSGGNTPSKNPFKPNEPNPTGNPGGNSRPKTPFNPFKPNSNQNTSPDWWQTNKHLVIFAGIACLVFFYLYSQKDEEYQPIRKNQAQYD